MHAFRALLVVAVVLVSASEGIFIKKILLKKAEAARVGFVEDIKLSSLKLKAAAALQKEAFLGGFKAVGKGGLGLITRIKAAKLGFLKNIVAAKLAKLAAIKAGKIAYVTTLAAARAIPEVAKKVHAGGAFLGESIIKKGLAGAPLLGAAAGIGGLGGFGGFGVPAYAPVAVGAPVNPLQGVVSSALGSLVNGALSTARDVSQRFDLSQVFGKASSPAQLFPQPGPPAINIQTYREAPIVAQSYAPPAPSYQSVPSDVYGPPAAPARTYGPPATSYGVPQV